MIKGMKKNINKFLTVGFVFVAVFSFIFTVKAQTWTAPTGTPPSNNVPGPINVGTSTQFKLGAFGIGESTSTTADTASGYTFEVNGPMATNGLASFGDTYITQFTHIGPVPTTTTYTGANNVRFQGSSVGAVSIAPPDGNSGIAGFFDRVGQTFAAVFNPEKTYAMVSGGLLGIGYPYVPDHAYEGPCYGNFCNSEQHCDAATRGCVNNTMGTNGGTSGNGWADGANSSTANFAAGQVPDLTAVLSWGPVYTGTTPVLSKTVTSGGSETLYWSVAGASSCSIVSSNQTNNYSLPAGSGSGYFNLNSAGFAHGYHNMSFSGAAPGNYTYTLACEPAAGTISPSKFITSVTLTIGNKLMLQVNGNTAIQGYALIDGVVSTKGGFLEQGSRVCLKNGANCPDSPLIRQYDQGGSLEVGGGNLTNSSGQVPYIDFHYGSSAASTQDYNARIINSADGILRFDNNSNSNIMSVGGAISQWNGSGTTSIDDSVLIRNSLVVDNANANSAGDLTGNALTFGSNSGQGIASRTTSGSPCQYSLSLFTNGYSRMDICNGTITVNGDLHVTGTLYHGASAHSGW